MTATTDGEHDILGAPQTALGPAHAGRSTPAALSARAAWLALAAILLVGGMLRFYRIDWDEGQHLHPDERFLTMVTENLRWPSSLAEYWDTPSNPLNPYNHGFGSYVYGLSPVIMAKALGELTGYTGYGGVYLAGRAMSAAMDLLSIVLVYLIGRRLYDRRVGLLGALLLSLSVLPIQHAHFFTGDPPTTLYVTLALYLAVRVAQGGGWPSMLGLGVAFGLAVSAKISVLSFLGVIGLALLQRALAGWERDALLGPSVLLEWGRRVGRFRLAVRVAAEEPGDRRHALDGLLLRALPAAVWLGVILLVAGLTFRVVQPQAFSGPGFFGLRPNPAWVQDMDSIQRLVTGETDYPPSHQWTAREPVWYALENLVLWGLGLPLGLAVWAAWGLMAYEMARGRWTHILPWAWMTFTFFYQSVQFVKTVRYMLPIYPTMALVAAYGLARAWDLARERAARPGAHRATRFLPYLAGGAGGLVVLGTAAWALAFMSIYTRPVTRVEASRWIYENIPPGSALTSEVWDDRLPLHIDGRNYDATYREVRMEPYWEDTPEKREALIGWLDQAEYIILSSNRLYESIPRLPMRYPMTTRYYEALFSGELGFERLKTFTSRPTLLGVEIVDDYADETFTVYDHPKVIIFRKRADFDLERVRALFAPYDLERVVRMRPIEVTRAPNGLLLDAETWRAQRRGGTWSEMFDRGDLANRLPTATWYLALAALGLAAFPLGFFLFRRLADRGYILSRTLGMLLLGYGAWLLPSLRVAAFTRGTVAALFLALLALGALAGWLQRREIGTFLRGRWRLVLANEALFLAFFLLFWLIRRGNPDLWHPVMGGEKPMDLAYLNAILRSTSFPPYDPWFAGGYLNYYYLGHALVAALIRLTGIVPTTAYNLAVPALFAMTATGAASVVYNLLPRGADEGGWFPRRLRFGLLGALLVAVVGNLGEVRLLIEGLLALGAGAGDPLSELWAGFLRVLGASEMPFRPEWWYWNASRVMEHGEINEFPFFTFLYADLHAHLIALPLTLLALGLVVGWVARPEGHEGRPARLARLGATALGVGVLWGRTPGTIHLPGPGPRGAGDRPYHERGRLDVGAAWRWALRAGAVVAGRLLLFWPYHAHYGAAYTSAGLWDGPRTGLNAYLTIHALPLYLLYAYAAVALADRATRHALVRALRPFLRTGYRRARARRLYDLLVRRQSLAYEAGWFALAFCGAVLAWALLTGAWPALLGLPLVGAGLLLALERRATPERRLVGLLMAAGAALTVAVEYVVVPGDIGRMNTVFKFYLQVWVLWGIAGAVALARVWPATRRWGEAARSAWRTGLVVLLVGVSLYPVYATYGKVRDRWHPGQPPGLDGAAYMDTARYADQGRELALAHDARAIRWLQDHVAGSPVLAEGNTPLYRWGNRVSVYTGLPTIIGWDWHQRQQRSAYSGQVVDWRLADLRTLYDGADIAAAEEILRRYEVAYVYVGELERAYYSPAGLAKFDEMVGETLEVAYADGPVTIYRVLGAEGSVAAAETQDGERAGWVARVADWFARNLSLGGAVYAEAPAAPGETSPLLDAPVEDLPVVDGRGWNAWANGSTLGAVVSWWLVVQVVGLAAWPLARATGRWADGGYALAKTLGLLVAGYLLWIGASLRVAMNTAPAAWGAVAALGVVAWGARPFFRRAGAAGRSARCGPGPGA